MYTTVLGMDTIALMRLVIICLFFIGSFEVVRAILDWWNEL